MRTLLFDYDGVLLRSHAASRIIAKRCARYVGRVTGINNPHQAEVLNKGLYTSYGHTVLGLRALGYNTSVREFNAQVYKGLDYNELGIHEAEFDLPLHLDTINVFSSAPDEWIIGTLGVSGYSRKALNKLRIIRPSNPELLKPDILAYCSVKQFVKNDIILFDDSFMNVMNAAKLKGWSSVWVTHDEFKINTNIKTALGVEAGLKTIAF